MSVIKHIGKHLESGDKSPDLKLPKKLSLINSEKVHLHFLKWALGVNKRASNIGSWGETGRYPLIFESINLTLKYIKRVKNLNDNSLVSLAFKEQQGMQLEWYRHMEPLLKTDPSYSSDHVTSYSQKSTKSTTKNLDHESHTKNTNSSSENFLIHNGFIKHLPKQTIRPLMSRFFTPHTRGGLLVRSVRYRTF